MSNPNYPVKLFLDCHFILQIFNFEQEMLLNELLKNKLREKESKIIELKGRLIKIAGNDKYGFNNSNMHASYFSFPRFLKCRKKRKKLFISDGFNHIIRSILITSTITIRKKNKSKDQNSGGDIGDQNWNVKYKWKGKLEIEVGQPKQEGYSNGNRNTCRLKCPNGFDWDKKDNMYICNDACICKVDSKSKVSLVAGHETDKGYKNGDKYSSRFRSLSGILCHQRNHQQSPLVLYVCDCWNHCIRMIDVTNGESATFAGKGKEEGDVNGTLQSSKFNCPCDIVKDDKNDHILYVSDTNNHKIKMIDMKKEMVTTLVGNRNDTSILDYPKQMQIIDSFIYVACSGYGFRNCIVRIDEHSKQVTKINFSDGEQVSRGNIYGIAYHELNQCFYISDECNIYKLE